MQPLTTTTFEVTKLIAKVEVKDHPMMAAGKLIGHPTNPEKYYGQQMTITFTNGYALSVLNGAAFYASGNGKTFEVGVMKDDKLIGDDVHGYQTHEEVEELIQIWSRK